MKSPFRIVFVVSLLASFTATNGLKGSQEVEDQAVVRYKFDGNLTDTNRPGVSIAQLGNVEYVPDRFGIPGKAISFKTIATPNPFLLGQGPLLSNLSSSVSFWVKKNYVGNGSNLGWVFDLGHAPGGSGGSQGADMHLALDYGQSIRYSFFYNDLDTNTPLPNFTWVNINCTFDYVSRVRKIYINGELDRTDVAQFPYSGPNYLSIGIANIAMDDFMLFKKALSPDEVQELVFGGDCTATESWRNEVLKKLNPFGLKKPIAISDRLYIANSLQQLGLPWPDAFEGVKSVGTQFTVWELVVENSKKSNRLLTFCSNNSTNAVSLITDTVIKEGKDGGH